MHMQLLKYVQCRHVFLFYFLYILYREFMLSNINSYDVCMYVYEIN